MILDSGNRTEYATGAVRDKQKGKGRTDLLPLDVVSEVVDHICGDGNYLGRILTEISDFQLTGNREQLACALTWFLCDASQYTGWADMLLDVSIHYEEGCEKYSENNWQKGIYTKDYINSAVRHLLKWYRGDGDERHDRAFVWNILCCMWTVKNKPELNTYGKDIEEWTLIN